MNLILRFLATTVSLIGLSGVTGWMLNLQSLIQIYPGGPLMVFNTGLCFLLTGIALLSRLHSRYSKAVVVSVIPATIGLATLLQYILGQNWGIDQFFWHQTLDHGLSHLGRMAPDTALCFLMINVSILLLGFEFKKTKFERMTLFALLLAAAVFYLSFNSLISLKTGLPYSYAWGSFTKMAVHTSLGFILLSFGIFLHLYDRSVNKQLPKKTVLAAAGINALFLLIFSVLFHLFVQLDSDRINETSKSNASLVGQKIHDRIYAKIQNLYRMSERWNQNPHGLTENQWIQEVMTHHRDFKSLRSSGWIDAEGTMQWVYPDEYAPEYRWSSIRKVTPRWTTFQKAIETQKVTLTPLVDLIIGGHGFMAFAPVTKMGRQDGALTQTIDLLSFLRNLELPEDYHFSISDGVTTFFESELNPNNRLSNLDPSWTSTLTINLEDTFWKVSATPKRATLRKEAGHLPLFVLVTGYLVAMLFGLVTFYVFAYREARMQTLRDLRWVNAIVDGSDLAMISTDTQGIVRSFNPRAEVLLGYTAEEVIGKCTPELWHDQAEVVLAAKSLSEWYQTKVQPGMQVFLFEAQLGIIEKSEWTFIRKDKTLRKVLLSVHSLKDERSETTGFVGIIEDITEQKAQLEQIRIQQEKLILSAKMASLGEMAAGVAHEVNNPLAIISNKVQLIRSQLEKGKLDSDKVFFELDRMDSTIHRIASIIQGLRSFARESENDPFSENQLHELMEETLDLCRQRISAKGVRLDLFLPEAPVYFKARGVQISQVILNLLNNALDALETSEEKWIRIKVTELQDKLQVVVSDSGSGIPENIREKIMQPFFTTKRIGQGTGLGLSISQGIVAQHGGHLYLDTTATTTTFIFEILKDPDLLVKVDF